LSTTFVYVDASVIAGVALGDVEPSLVISSVPKNQSLAYGTFGFGEAVSAISARTRAAHGTDQDAIARVDGLRAFLTTWRHIDWVLNDLDRAIGLAGRASLALKLPDAIHIAIAERLALPLLTLDRQQFVAARSLGLAPILPANPD